MSHRSGGGGSPPPIEEKGPSGPQDQLKKRSDPERSTINLSNDSKSETKLVPSNQQAGAENTQNDKEDDLATLGLLTQYIGPLKTNPNKPSSKTSEDRRILNLTEQLKDDYVELTEDLDRATSHLESLRKAITRGRTPTGLKITLRPMVMHRDDPTFTRDWDETIKRCENEIITTIIKHLQRIVENRGNTIRGNTERCYKAIKTINPNKAKLEIEKTLKMADEAHQKKKDTKRKQKLEAKTPKWKNNKKTRKEDYHLIKSYNNTE